MDQNTRAEFWASLLDRIDRWLKHAEAKNGLLLTVSLGTIGLALRIDRACSTMIADLFFYSGVLIILTSALRLIIEFRPRVKPNLEKTLNRIGSQESDTLEDPNPLFFGHIATLSLNEFTALISESLDTKPNALTRLDSYYVHQIYINSGIASRKFKAFTDSVRIYLAGMAPLLLSLSST